LEAGRRKLVLLAKRHGIALRQSYEREGPTLRRRAGGYAHAKQFKRMRRVLRRQRTVLGRVIRDIERKLADAGEAAKAALGTWLDRAKRL
ncbi:IS5/IS1182 family transposase, partial [Acinetobacter baumannii]